MSIFTIATILRPVLALSEWLTGRLFWWLILAAAMGLIFQGAAAALEGSISIILAVMIAGLGVTIHIRDLGAGLMRIKPLGLGIGAQLIFTPIIGFVVWKAVGSTPEWAGVMIQAVAPSEITSPLMASLAGGLLSVSIPIMAISILLAPFLMPALLRLALGQRVPVPVASMLQSLLLTVALPLLAGSVLFTLLRQPAPLARVGRGVSAAMVILLIFVVAGTAAAELDVSDWPRVLGMAGIALGLLAAGFGGGWAAGRIGRVGAPTHRGLIFTTGMREFGVASAVALGFFSAQASAFPAVYGIVMMLVSAWLAGRLGRGRSDPVGEAR